jgi:hypothetical protein
MRKVCHWGPRLTKHWFRRFLEVHYWSAKSLSSRKRFLAKCKGKMSNHNHTTDIYCCTSCHSQVLYLYKLFILQHVHIHILPRKKGDFKENDDVYHQVSDFRSLFCYIFCIPFHSVWSLGHHCVVFLCQFDLEGKVASLTHQGKPSLSTQPWLSLLTIQCAINWTIAAPLKH